MCDAFQTTNRTWFPVRPETETLNEMFYAGA